MVSRRRKKAFTLTEISIVLVVIGLLAAVAVPTYRATRANTQENSNVLSLAGFVAKARKVASMEGNQYSYPVDLPEVLNGMDDRIVESASFGPQFVSVWRVDSNIVVFAQMDEGGKCMIVRDDIASDTQKYAMDASTSNCMASETSGVLIEGSTTQPNVVDLD
jgi:prepilin-type N-terminal cleavage/methylation domain-containing protein